MNLKQHADLHLDQAELKDLAKYRSCEIADGSIAISYLAAHQEWDKLAQALVRHQATINALAGIVAQLLPVVPTYTKQTSHALETK